MAVKLDCFFIFLQTVCVITLGTNVMWEINHEAAVLPCGTLTDLKGINHNYFVLWAKLSESVCS